MNFLERLYSNENFGIYLFAIIAILVVLFFIVLFFGKKDSKKSLNENKKEEPVKENNLENTVPVEPINDTFKEITEPIKLESEVVLPTNKEPEEPKVEEKNDNVVNNVVLNSNLVNEESEEPEKIENNEEIENKVLEEKEFDFDALADAIIR